MLELSRQAAVQQPLATEPTENAGSESSYESSSESTTGWTSSDDDDDDEEDAVADTEEARAARAAERFRVLQAAGLIVTDEKPSRRAAPRRPPPDLLVRRKSSRQAKPERPDRRPPRPKRSKEKLKTKPERPLPPVPASARPAEAQMEDAYDRFLKLSKEVSLQRLPELPNEYGSPRPASVAGSIASTTRRPFSPPTTQPDSPALSHTSETATESRTSGFLNSIKHMSRAKMNASPMERRPTPTISGPISAPSPQLHQRSESSQGTSASPMGTTSWSSIVGPSALEMIPDKERKRQEAIFELIATESAHVRDLQIIVEVFFNSMQQTQLLSEKASTVIFANVEDVLLAAVSLLSDLEERQRDNRLYIDHIGDILAKHMPGMQV